MVSGGEFVENLSEMLKGFLEGIVLEIISRGEIYGYKIVKQLKNMGFEGIAEGTSTLVKSQMSSSHYTKDSKRHKPKLLVPFLLFTS